MAQPIPISPRPSVPPPYTSGVVNIPANQPMSLLALIQQDISLDCPGTSTEFQLWADPSNVAPVWIGQASALGGPLTAATAAYGITPMAGPRIYHSSYPGTQTPVGVLQVFSEAPAKLHIEVIS